MPSACTCPGSRPPCIPNGIGLVTAPLAGKQQQAADEAAEAGAADGAADASAADEAGGGSSSDAEPRTPAAGAPDAAAGSSPFLKVLRTCKPEEGKPLIFEVQLREGGTALVPSVRLRREVPLLLVDFYESRMAFPA